MFVADGPFFSGCLAIGGIATLIVLIVIGMAGLWVAKIFHIDEGYGILIVLFALLFMVRYLRKRKTKKLEYYDY